MAFFAHPAAPESARSVLGTPSKSPCGVCGHHALDRHDPDDDNAEAADRLFCLICGAHHHFHLASTSENAHA